MDLGVRAAGANVTHHPEVIVLAEAENAFGGQITRPEFESIVVFRVDSGKQAFRFQLHNPCQKYPGKVDCLALEVIAEREVAQHLEEGVVARRGTDVLQVVVLALHTHDLLGCGGSLVGTLFLAQEDIDELIHAGIGEQQCRIIALR